MHTPKVVLYTNLVQYFSYTNFNCESKSLIAVYDKSVRCWIYRKNVNYVWWSQA